MQRHRTSDDLRATMQRALAAPTVETSDGTRRNPLAAMEEVGRVGPFGALVSAWAIIGDVLSFYQQRIGEEGALSTARETVSGYAIARGVGFEPRPAVSATTDLAFSVGLPPAGGSVTIPAGIAVGNVPAEGSLPAIFETSADLVAHRAWNAVAATPDDVPSEARLAPLATRIVLAGTQPIAAGDAIVVRTGTAGEPVDAAAIIADVTADVARDRTLVRWRVPLSQFSERAVTDVLVLDTRARIFGALAPPFDLAPAAERRKYAFGGFTIREGGDWTAHNDGLDVSPFALAALRDGWCGITTTSFLRARSGEDWTVGSPAPGVTLQSLAVSPSGRIAVGTTGGDVYISSDDGDVWLRIGGDPAARGTRRLPALPIRGIAFDESGEVPDIYVATDRGVAQIAINGNAWSWRNDGFPGTDPKTGYAACAVSSIVFDGATGTMLTTTTYGAYTTGSGRTWKRIEGLGSIAQIDALTNGRFVAAGPGGVFLSVDDAQTWVKVIEPDAAPRALAAAGDTIAVGAGYDAFTSDDGGSTWWRLRDVSRSRIAALAVNRDACVGVASPLIDNPLHEWPGLDVPLHGTTLTLDRPLALLPGEVIAIGKTGTDVVCTAYRVRSATTHMLRGYGMAAMGTIVVLDTPIVGELSARDAQIYVGARSRSALRVHRGALPPPDQSLPIARAIPPLSTDRSAIVEGRPPQALVAGLAGGAFTIRFDATGTAQVGERNPADVVPDRDADEVVRLGERGAALARFDGAWRCDDVFAPTPAWTPLPLLDPAPTSIAVFDDALYVAGSAGAFVYGEAGWRAAGPASDVRRVVSWTGTTPGILACAKRGAFAFNRADGLWEPAAGLVDVSVFAVAAQDDTVVAGTSNGVYRQLPGQRWERIDGLVPRAVHAIAIAAGTIYAGTAGAGLWQFTASGWEPVTAFRSTGDIRRLELVTLPGHQKPAIIAAEAGYGVTINGKLVAAGVATSVAGFVSVANGSEPVVVAFRGAPALGSDPALPLRRWIGTLDEDRAESELLDAGMMTGGFRDRLAKLAGIKLDAFEVVVEGQGAAWRLRGGDDMPTLLLRREARARLDIFEVQCLDVRVRPVARGEDGDADPLLRWHLSLSDGPAIAFHARASEMWFAPARAAAPIIAEPVTIASHTPGQVLFRSSLYLAFDPRTASMLANVARATHGASVPADEPIAGGDPGRPGQTATLARTPLTYVFAKDATHPHPEIDVWVRSEQQTESHQRGSSWRVTEHMLEHGPRDRVFTVKHRDDGTAVLTFGDGVHGARLPRGTENVVARYRFGAGPGGNVAANALTLMQKVLPYVERVRNPLSATGGTAADRLEDLRRTIPIGMIAFDRVVSERDLVDFVRAFPGVAKVDVRRRHGVGAFAVTYACRDGDRVDEAALKAALRENGAQTWSVVIRPARLRTFAVTATLVVAPGDTVDRVALARAALLNAYGFEMRELNSDVIAAALIDLLQSLKGIIAVQLSALHECGTIVRVEDRIVATRGDGGVAALLTIDPAGINLQQETLEATG